MPVAYTPPQPHRPQVVRSRRGTPIARWRWWWLVPVLGLVPLLAAALATQGAFSPRNATQPVAAAPTLETEPATPEHFATSGAAAQPTSTVAAGNATSPTSEATPVTAAASASPSAVTAGASASASPVAAAAASTAPTSSSPATAETSTRASATSSGPYVAYRVQSGDTVRFIAHTYGVSTASIIQASGLTNPDLLHPGQVLTVPAQPGWLYRVQPGETLDQIAARTGVGSDRIASASGMSIASVGPGAVVLIPDEAAGKSK